MIKRSVLCLVASFGALSALSINAADPAPSKPTTKPVTKPVLTIIPGKVIVPFDNMRRPWGELVSLDLATRTGTFRKEGTDEIMPFTVMPYAELLHHAANGDLQDFRIGERAIFRLHPNENGEWTWLTYIQDEMNMMNGHKEYFFVDEIDPTKGTITATQANADKSFVREKGIVIETDQNTRYWKAGEPAKFADIHTGDKLRTKTHGVGKGKTRVAWEVFLDEESLLKFQAEQRAVHTARMAADGAPGYVDSSSADQLELTIFGEAADEAKQMKVGKPVAVAPAGVDRKPTRTAIRATVVSNKAEGRQTKITLKVEGTPEGFKPTELARVWVVKD